MYNELDIGKVLKDGWDSLLRDIVPLTISSTIAMVLGVLTLGILMPALCGGVMKSIMLRVREGRQPLIGDVFMAMDQWGTLLWAMIMVGCLVILGFCLCVIPGLILSVMYVYILPIILDQRKTAWESMQQSWELVKANNFWTHCVCLLVLFVICGVVGMIPLAVLFTTPFWYACIVAMYGQIMNRMQCSSRAAACAAAGQGPGEPPVIK